MSSILIDFLCELPRRVGSGWEPRRPLVVGRFGKTALQSGGFTKPPYLATLKPVAVRTAAEVNARLRRRHQRVRRVRPGQFQRGRTLRLLVAAEILDRVEEHRRQEDAKQ